MRLVDAIVIGGGAMGTAVARSLAELGRETVLFEQFEIGHARGSSHGPSRVFRLAYPQADYVRMAQRALESWRRLEDAAGETLLVPTGGLYAGRWAGECGAALAECGVRRSWLPAAEASERFPAMSFDGIDRLLWQEEGGVCLADRTIAAQTRLARAAGVDVREHAEVEHVLLGERGIVVDAGGEERVEAKVAVVAAGPWSGGLLSELAIELPLRPAFAQVAYFGTHAGESPLGLPTFIEADRLEGGLGAGGYWIPPVGGGNNLKAGDGTPGKTIDPALGPLQPDLERAARDGAWVSRRLRAIDPEPAGIETCIYTMTPDQDFVLERVGPVVVCSCCSGHGFKFVPLIGEIVAGLATGVDPRIPDGRFSSSRVSLAAAG